MTEKELTKEMKKYWKNNGWLAIRNQQNIGSHKGLADFIVLKDGMHIFVELKGEKGRQSPIQKDFQKNIEDNGGNYCLCKSIDDFENYVNLLYMNKWLQI